MTTENRLTVTVTTDSLGAMLVLPVIREMADRYHVNAVKLALLTDDIAALDKLLAAKLTEYANALESALYGDPTLAAGDHFRYPEQADPITAAKAYDERIAFKRAELARVADIQEAAMSRERGEQS